jgi:hypothetical protein
MPHTLRQDLDTLHQSMVGEPLPADIAQWDHLEQAITYLMTQRDPTDDDGGAPAWFRDQRVGCAWAACPNLTTDTYCSPACLARACL